MAKYKPAKGKKKAAPAPQGAIPCVILVVLAIAAVMLLLFFVMKSSSGN
jgi:flagellar basal body-associated protein FliL